MSSFRDLKLALLAMAILILWWGRGLLALVPRLLLALLCRLCCGADDGARRRT